MKPKVSILICTYNCEQYIENTLQTIFNQTYKNWELLILDNNSQDNTKKILKKHKKNKKIKLFFSKNNKGAYAGLNYLLDKAKGKYIAIQDHDDLWHPQKLEKQIEFLSKNKKYVGCGTEMIEFYEFNKKYNLFYWPEIYYFAMHTSLVFRNKKKYRYNEKIPYYTDAHFMRYILCNNTKNIYNLNQKYVLHIIRKDGLNLANKWDNFDNFKNIMYYQKLIFNKNDVWFLKIAKYLLLKMPFKLKIILKMYFLYPKQYHKVDLNKKEFKEYKKYF